MANEESMFWSAFRIAWDEQRFLVYLRTWLSNPERSDYEIKALCDAVAYDPIRELALIEALARLDQTIEPAALAKTA